LSVSVSKSKPPPIERSQSDSLKLWYAPEAIWTS
jgi:hypothetical protein